MSGGAAAWYTLKQRRNEKEKEDSIIKRTAFNHIKKAVCYKCGYGVNQYPCWNCGAKQ